MRHFKHIHRLLIAAALAALLFLPGLYSNAAGNYSPPEEITTTSVDYSTNRVDWTPVEGASGYLVYRRTNSTTWKQISKINDGSADSYLDTASADHKVTFGTTYYYTVASYYEVEEDGTTKTVKSTYDKTGVAVTTDIASVDLSTISVETVNSKKLKITWEATSDATGYLVYRKTPTSGYVKIATVTGNSYTDTGPKQGYPYIYTIQAYKKINGKNYYAQYDKEGVKGATTIPAPALVSISSPAYNQVKITWKSVAAAKGYAILRKEAGGTFEQIATVSGQNTLSYTDKTAISGTPYVYSVRAYNTVNGVKYYGLRKAGLSISTRPSRVYLDSVSSESAASVTIKWKTSVNATGYRIYRRTADTSFKQIGKVEDPSATSYTDTTALPGVTYYYTVKSYATVLGNTTYSLYDKTGLSVTIKPGQPDLPVVSSYDSTSLLITFKPVKIADGYGIYRKTAGGSWKLIKSIPADATEYLDTGLETGQTYYYSVRAYVLSDGKKFWGDYDKKGTESVVRPDAVFLFGVSSYSYNTAKITWDPLDNVDGYQIFRRQGSGSWTKVADITDCSTDTYKDSGLVTGESYTYTVASYVNINGTTVLSTYGSDYLSATILPSTPTIASAQFTDSLTATIKWKSVAGADGYRVYRKVMGGSWETIATLSSSSVLTYSDQDAEPGMTYYYSVAAYHVENGTKVWGKKNASGRWVRACMGIDVSKWQYTIDWDAVAADGIEFVIIRASYGQTTDPTFYENYEGAKAAGLKVGVYTYSYASSVAKATAEAEYVLSLIEGCDLDLPVFYDFEDKTCVSTNKSTNKNRIMAFCDTIIDAGYETGLYSSATILSGKMDYSSMKDYNIWIANYHSNDDDYYSSYKEWSSGNSSYDFGPVFMWQYTSKGTVAGIGSKYVDRNLWYTCQ